MHPANTRQGTHSKFQRRASIFLFVMMRVVSVMAAMAPIDADRGSDIAQTSLRFLDDVCQWHDDAFGLNCA